MLTLNLRLPADPDTPIQSILSLTAEERTRSRYRFETDDGRSLRLELPRGTVLRDGDLLALEGDRPVVRVVAKPELVLHVTAKTQLELLRATYHLGNRHVPLEITADYLRLSPDSVLKDMLEHLGLQVTEAILPFQPETGAYGHSH